MYYKLEEGKGLFTLAERWDDIRDLHLFVPTDHVLDIGCAEGCLTNEVAQRVKNIDGIDIDREAVDTALRLYGRPGRVGFYVDSITQWQNWAEHQALHYDVVLFLGVIHHLPAAEQLPSLKNVLKVADRLVVIRAPFGWKYSTKGVALTCKATGFRTELVGRREDRKVGNLLLAYRKRRISLISYPKAGRTWLRSIIALSKRWESSVRGRAFSGRDLLDIGDLYADRGIAFDVHHDGDPHLHDIESISDDKEKYFAKGGRVILMARDPRDIVVSLWFEFTKRKNALKEPVGSLEEFVRSKRGGLPSVIRFYNSWAPYTERLRPSGALVKLVYYEVLRRGYGSWQGATTRLFDWLGIWVSMEKVGAIFAYTDAARMQLLEQAGAFSDHPALTPGNPCDPESFKVRRAKVGGYRDYMSAELQAWCTEQLKGLQEPFRSHYT